MGVTERVAFARDLVGRGRKVAPVARVLQISRQAIYRTPKPRKPPQRRPPQGPVEEAIVDVAKENPTDGYRMVCVAGTGPGNLKAPWPPPSRTF